MGLWTALTNQPPFNASQMLQLTDGTVIVQQEDGNDASRHWWRLTPDKFGKMGIRLTQVAPTDCGLAFPEIGWTILS